MSRPQPTPRLRTAFISDVHLGFKGCRAALLLGFMRRVECEQIYLVRDIIDLWSLQQPRTGKSNTCADCCRSDSCPRPSRRLHWVGPNTSDPDWSPLASRSTPAPPSRRYA